MNRFEFLLKDFSEKFAVRQFPIAPATLYDPNEYFLSLGGKRVRPVMCLMGNDLFDTIQEDAYHVASAIELFHNFSLIHDDIMDHAPLRRGMTTLHEKYGSATALLAGDVMLVKAYEYISRIQPQWMGRILQLFNKTAREVCEGQQLDMDFESRTDVRFEEYIHMIELKTSVLLAASLKMGAILGGASEGNLQHIYEFGKNLGIAFQIQDDYLDAFGDPSKFGKQVGGDIKSNKKTFLWIHVHEVATDQHRAELELLLTTDTSDKVDRMLNLYRACGVDQWAKELKRTYFEIALSHLDAIAVISERKQALQALADFLISRDH